MRVTPDDAHRVRLVVGLGNPGQRYARTRHNVGFRVVDVLAGRWGVSSRPAFEALLGDARLERQGCPPCRVLLAKPQTFMNRSGQAVADIVRYYHLADDQVLIVLDDIDLPTGRLRLRSAGSAAGHKGLVDILSRQGTEQINRLRIGVGQPPAPMASEDYVLAPFSDDEAAVVDEAVTAAANAAEDWVFEGPTAVMNRINAMDPGGSPELSANGSQTADPS